MPNRVNLVERKGYHKRLQAKRKVFIKVGHKIESKCQVIKRKVVTYQKVETVAEERPWRGLD